MDPHGTALGRAIDALDASWSDITHVVITHVHPDHIGGLEHAWSMAPGATVVAGQGDGVVGAQPASDGDRIGGLRVLGTPGHTPGHISLVAVDGSVVLVGDAVGAVGGRLSRGPAAFTADPTAADRSLRRVLEIGSGRMLFGHGEEISDPWPALASLVDG
jgi:glyoxylase-like metal-dependent hydrolase (beta-lactamase superfamily II)